MSRSYKKTARSGDTKDKFFKRYANRRLRRKPIDEDVLQNKEYKKDFCSYDICDYQSVGTTFEQYCRMRMKYWYQWRCHYGEPCPTKEELLNEYLHWYKRK